MEDKGQNDSYKLEQKLMKTANRIRKNRKNVQVAEKEAAEFEEIRKLLDDTESEKITVDHSSSHVELPEDLIDCSTIPLSIPWLTVFNEDLLFSLFNEETICLSNFVEDEEEKKKIFGESEVETSEETFRELISSRLIEISMPEQETCPTVGLYVFHLMSVHEDADFVDACHDFLKFRPFQIRPKDVLRIFRNYGAESEENHLSWNLNEERLLRKLYRNDGNIDKISSKRTVFPFHNLETIGKILIEFVTGELFEFTHEVKHLIRLLGKLALDRTIRSGYLTPIYSSLVTVLCLKTFEGGVADVNEIADLLDFPDLNPLLRSEICRTVVIGPLFPELQKLIAGKTVGGLLKHENAMRPFRSIGIEETKFILQKCKKAGETTPLEIYSLLQILTSSLPGITATVEDSMEINVLLAQLDRRISQTDDSVDLIRLKRELAKVRNLVANKRFERGLAFAKA